MKIYPRLRYGKDEAMYVSCKISLEYVGYQCDYKYIFSCKQLPTLENSENGGVSGVLVVLLHEILQNCKMLEKIVRLIQGH